MIKIYGLITVIVLLFGSCMFVYRIGYNIGHNDAYFTAEKATEKIINELETGADETATAFINCRNAGRVWSFAANKCKRKNIN